MCKKNLILSLLSQGVGELEIITLSIMMTKWSDNFYTTIAAGYRIVYLCSIVEFRVEFYFTDEISTQHLHVIFLRDLRKF